MSTPIRHAAAVATLIVAVAAGLSAFGEAVAPVYPAAKARAALLDSAAPHIEAITLGSSHNVAIDFDTLGTEGFHLWRSGGDLAEARYMLTAVQQRLPALRLVLFPVLGFHHDNASIGEPWIQVRYQTYAEAGGYRPIPGDWRSFLHAQSTPIVRPDHWSGVLRVLLGRQAPENSVEENGWPTSSPTTAVLPPDSLLAYAEARGRYHDAMEASTLSSKPDACAAARSDLEALVAIAGPATVAFYTPPYHPAYSRWIAEEAECHLRAVADSLADALPNVYYFEYDDTAPFFRKDLHLRDGDHLNLPGARAFSAELRRRLIAEGVLGRSEPPQERL